MENVNKLLEIYSNASKLSFVLSLIFLGIAIYLFFRFQMIDVIKETKENKNITDALSKRKTKKKKKSNAFMKKIDRELEEEYETELEIEGDGGESGFKLDCFEIIESMIYVHTEEII